MKKVVQVSLETGNTDGASVAAFNSAIEFLMEEMKDEHGVDIQIPVDVVGAEYFYVPPSGDVLVNPEATTAALAGPPRRCPRAAKAVRIK